MAFMQERTCFQCNWASEKPIAPTPAGPRVFCERRNAAVSIELAENCESFPGAERSRKFSDWESKIEIESRKREVRYSRIAIFISILSLAISLISLFKGK